ncbi:MAG: PIN domain-containing protein [Acidobacteriota bacterium]|nr:PIN domain-containing protein [Acidobacteriota bacterium]
MIDYLTDTNVFSEIFKGSAAVKNFVENLENSLDATVYIECLQGSKGNREKQIIKKYPSKFPLFHLTPNISKRTISLIDRYSNSHGLLLPDAQVAAVCLEHDLTLVTYNSGDFKFINGLKWLKPDV